MSRPPLLARRGKRIGIRRALRRRMMRVSGLTVLLLLTFAGHVHAQNANPSLEIYGFAMLDIGHNFKAIDPNWSDTLRATKLPSFEGEFGKNHSTFAGVRQTQFGVNASAPTALGELKTNFEFDLFGTGV